MGDVPARQCHSLLRRRGAAPPVVTGVLISVGGVKKEEWERSWNEVGMKPESPEMKDNLL